MRPLTLIILLLAVACTPIPSIDQGTAQAPTGGSASSSIIIIPKGKKETAPPTVNIEWISPSVADINVKNVGGKVEVKVRITSPSEIKLEQIDILVNGQPTGNKAGEVGLLKRPEYKDQILTAQVPLNEGTNAIQIAVTNAGDQRYMAERSITKTATGIKVEAPSVADSKTRIVWTQPDVFALKASEMYNARTPELEVKFNITTPDNIDKSKIKIFVNNKYLAPSPTAELLGSNGNYAFRDKVLLNENVNFNEVALKVEAVSGASESQRLKINYSPSRPNLYVLSIGTQTNLKYTKKDARDFANIFYAQGKDVFRLFTNVTIDTLIGKAATAAEIKGSIESISTKLRTGTILEDDVVLVFISTHGFIENGEFRLQGDDFSSSKLKSTSVNYATEVLAELDHLNCKKLVFLDACHSGGAKAARPEDINRASRELKTIKKGLAIFASSSNTEESHEDITWQNGAFTECLIKGLTEGAADANKNGIVTLYELEKYVAAEVPPMVKRVKNKEQHPILTRNDLGDVPIFVIRKK
jgi:hypothetical protein